MKNILAKLTFAFLLVATTGALFTHLGVTFFRHFSVIPTFPYYYDLLLYTRDAAYALWGYFDGVHYLRLINSGYVDVGTQAFFPLYPLLSSWVSLVFGTTAYVSGLLVSWVFLGLSLFVLWHLFPRARARQTLALLLFPTSFFFFAVYTESLFLFFSLTFFLFLQQKRYFLAAVFAALGSATRLVGVFLGLVLLLDLYRQTRHPRPFTLLAVTTLSLAGFFAYCLFLYHQFGDPLMFLHVQSMFGAERSGGALILLPQVLYRYLKMVLTVDPTSFLYQRIWLELIFFLGAIWAWAKNLKHHSLAINLYVISSLLLPTLTGTLSSIPRYILVLVPFLLPNNLKKYPFYILLTINYLLLIYLFFHFTHGTFVA